MLTASLPPQRCIARLMAKQSGRHYISVLNGLFVHYKINKKLLLLIIINCRAHKINCAQKEEILKFHNNNMRYAYE